MKKSMLNLVFVSIFVFTASSVFAQYDQLMASAGITVPPVAEMTHDNPPATNVDQVVAEIRSYLDEHVKAPEAMYLVYNADVTIVASFVISTEGHLEDISISEKSDKLLGKRVVKELNELSEVTPILEDGKPVVKYVQIPVVFKIK